MPASEGISSLMTRPCGGGSGKQRPGQEVEEGLWHSMQVGTLPTPSYTTSSPLTL